MSLYLFVIYECIPFFLSTCIKPNTNIVSSHITHQSPCLDHCSQHHQAVCIVFTLGKYIYTLLRLDLICFNKIFSLESYMKTFMR